MKSYITKTTVYFVLLSFIFAACSKDPVFQNPKPGPGKPVEAAFRFIADTDLSGEPYHSSNLTAVVSITTDKGVEVVTEKRLTLDLSGPVKTESIKLPVGNYKLSRFRLVYGGVNTNFATPITGSAKASQVEKPLPIVFTVGGATTANVPVEVLRVQRNEKPQAYGYPKGSFDDNQSENNPYLKVKLRATMQIGTILYDSIPASLRVTTWNDKGEMTTTYAHLNAGTNEISLLKAATTFELEVTKWNATYKLILDREKVNEDTVYILGGNRIAKKLKSELTYRLVDGNYKAESKNEYLYEAAGKLSKINYYLKRKDNSPYLAMVDVFEYNGANVQTIRRYDEAKKVISVISFSYDGQGKVRSIAQDENGQKTNATVDYLSGTHEETGIHYSYPGKTYTMEYAMRFYGGNLINGTATTSHGNLEIGQYDYDFEINPYAHMNWPNLFLSNSSKNNMINQYKTYQYNHPTIEPYSFSFTYDEEGYPKEQVKKFKSYVTNAHLYTTKTVYVY